MSRPPMLPRAHDQRTTVLSDHRVGPGAAPAAKTRWWRPPAPATDTPPLSARRAYAEVLVVFGVFFAAGIAAAALAGHDPSGTVNGWTQAVPASIDQVAETALCVMTPVLLMRRRGRTIADLGIDSHRPSIPASQGIRIAAWALLALLAGSLVTGLLATDGFAVGAFSYPDLTINLFHAAQAGFIEEIIVLAFVVATLEQARRPRPEIVAVALVLRMSYHIYYGPGVLGILIWASVFLWLFLRFRTVIPLIIVHSCWDVFAFLDGHWKWVAAIEALAWFGLFLTAFILWLVYRSDRNRPQPIAAPGWYPDPSGQVGVRWFTGWQWSPVTRPF